MSTFDVRRSRVQGEFLEMPGMRLTPEQVQRLSGIEPTMCDLVLQSLVDADFLYQTPDGAYARLTDGEQLVRPRASRVHLIMTVP